MLITINHKTPTINHLYGFQGSRKFMKSEARKLKEAITNEILQQVNGAHGLENKALAIEVRIHENWYCQNGTVARKDISNREKFLIDCVFEALELDDKFIFKHILQKLQNTDREYAEVYIYALE